MSATFFAPHLAAKNVRDAMEFYQRAFNAQTLRSWENHDGSVHVAEMSIDGALFHIHEEVPGANQMSPETTKSTSILIGLFCPDPDQFVRQAELAGGIVTHPIQDYDYGYRQCTILDPFKHQWLVQKKI